MKNLHTITETTQFPKFWNEEWLNVAIKELDTKVMSPEQRLNYEMTISANALAIKNENKKIEEAEKRVRLETKKETILKLLTLKVLSPSQIAETVGVSEDYVTKLSKEQN